MSDRGLTKWKTATRSDFGIQIKKIIYFSLFFSPLFINIYINFNCNSRPVMYKTLDNGAYGATMVLFNFSGDYNGEYLRIPQQQCLVQIIKLIYIFFFFFWIINNNSCSQQKI